MSSENNIHHSNFPFQKTDAPQREDMNLVIYGAGGHAKVIAELAAMCGFKVVGFLDNQHPERAGEVFHGGRVLGGESELRWLKEEGVTNAVVAFGNCAFRLATHKRLVKMGFTLPTLVHPQAVVSPSACIGAGTVIIAGAIINACTRIGEACILNTSCSVGHDCVIEDGVHIAPGVRLAGWTRVGQATWIGIGSSVIEKVVIGRNCTIGAGSVIVHSIPADVTAYGCSAQVRQTSAAAQGSEPNGPLTSD